jgi:hypothetical protein
MDKRSHPFPANQSNLQPASGSMSAVADIAGFQSLPLCTVFSGCVRRGGIAQSFYSQEDQNALPTSTALLSSLDVEWNLGASHREPL